MRHLQETTGILTRATDAKEQIEIADEKEAIQLAYAGAVAEKRGTGDITAIDLNNEFTTNGRTDANASGENPIIVTFDSGRSYTIDADGNITGPIDKMGEIEEISNLMWEYNTNTTTGKVTLTKYIGEASEVVVPSHYKINNNVYEVEIGISSYNQGPFNGAIIGNYKLKSVTFEDGVTFQNNDAKNVFQNNYLLTYVNAIPNGVTNISSAFYNCTSLETMPILPDSIVNMQYTFFECDALKKISELPENVTLLNYTFKGCNSLEEMSDIPLKVTNMNATFRDCQKLKGTLIINSSNVVNLANAFEGTIQNIILKVPAESTTYTTCVDSGLPSNVTLETQDVEIEDSYINLTKIYGIVGQELEIYFNNIIYSKEEYTVDVICDYGEQTEDKWSYTPMSEGEFDITIKIKNDNNIISTKTSTISISSIQSVDDELKYLAIGDSTTAAGGYTQNLLDNFNSSSISIKLLGTQGVNPNLHEGRGGWSFETYQFSMYGTTKNPFYNTATNGFDFNYYMNNNSYNDLDYVTIGLGINGLFGCKSNIVALQYINTMIEDLETMINSIQKYNSDIKIGILVTIPPTENEKLFNNDYSGEQTLERYRLNNILWCNKLITNYSEKENNNIYLIPTNAIIDCVNGFSNGVHPNTTGYNQIGNEIYGWILSTL